MDLPYALAVALAVGLVIGAERGWTGRTAAEGSRLAGIRSFALLGLLGGVAAALAQAFGAWILAAGFLASAVLLGIGHVLESRRDSEVGITTALAGVLTYAIAALGASGSAGPALGAAVVVALLLGFKSQIHGLLQQVEPGEGRAALQLLALAAVVIPLLPEQAPSGWLGLAPREIGLLVLLLHGLGLASRVAMRAFGARHGLLLFGATGGLVSSTSVVLQMSRGIKRAELPPPHAAAAALAACTVMLPRVLLLAALSRPALLATLWGPCASMGLVLAGCLIWLLTRTAHGSSQPAAGSTVGTPQSLLSAVQMAALIAGIGVVVELARRHHGDAGMLLSALIGGIADVDAMTLALARTASDNTELLARAVVVAMLANTASKLLIAAMLGGRDGRRLIAVPLLLAALAGSWGALA